MPIKRSFSNIYSEMDKINVNRKKGENEKKSYEEDGKWKVFYCSPFPSVTSR